MYSTLLHWNESQCYINSAYTHTSMGWNYFKKTNFFPKSDDDVSLCISKLLISRFIGKLIPQVIYLFQRVYSGRFIPKGSFETKPSSTDVLCTCTCSISISF